MSKPGCRPNGTEIASLVARKKRLQDELRKEQKDQGLNPESHGSYENTTSRYQTKEEELEDRVCAVTEHMRII